ncbi:MAG TPA: ABC transporter substrate-binding protein [bacterium]|nr:ABC transporter substrate-binding protein [Dictyoglomota bacterium]HRR91143.1 ABC transporter substrate-binding protein [bacterium]
MKKFLVGIVVLGLVFSVFAGFNSVSFAQKKYNEAPVLAELVKAGKLPPVEERLPENPVVFTQDWNEIPSEDMKLEIGRYGGTLRLADPSPESGSAPETWCFCREPLFVTPGIDTMGEMKKGNLRGNVFESYKVSKDFKTYTFYMRKGLKWSDGTPVTTEDVRFRFEDVYLNEKLTPIFPAWLKVNYNPNEGPGKLKVIDKYTFSISFPKSYPLFIAYLALRWNSWDTLLIPSHYMKQFHAKYTPLEKLEPLIQKESFGKGEWWRLFWSRNSYSGQHGGPASGFPTLDPWVYKEQPATGIFVFERNPYYFKVDAAGNQLPYIDRVRVQWVTDLKMQTMKIIAGEVDFAVNRTNLTDFPLFKENESAGHYKVALLKQHVTPYDIFLNLTYKDPVWRTVVRNVKFRQALNMAINRNRIIEVVQLGKGSLPTKAKVPFEYDPEKANKILDSIGLNKRDADGWRLGPDGKRFIIPFEVPIWTVGTDKVTELVAEDWRKVGIYTTVKVIDMSLASTRREANENKAMCFWLDWAVYWPLNPMAWACSIDILFDDWGPLWRDWYYSKGKTGEEPPPDIKRFISALERVVATGDDKVREGSMKQVYKMLYDNVYFFPIAESYYPMIYNENFGNIPVNTEYGISAAYSAEQFFFRK